MPITLPAIDDRDFDTLVKDALTFASVHAPEWTHTGPSDPGVTLVELFAFMAEALLYRANLIPERNRLKFLQLLGIPVRPANPAHGLVQLLNETSEHRTLTSGLQLFADALPFVTDDGLDVPPVEGLAVFKRTVISPDPALLDYYKELYEATGRDWLAASGTSAGAGQSGATATPPDPVLYETVALDDLPAAPDIGAEAVDGALWLAVLATEKTTLDKAREQLAGRTLSIGLIPEPANASARLIPGSPAAPPPALTVRMPKLNGAAGSSNAAYCLLGAVAPEGFPDRAGILQVTLPPEPKEIFTWPEAEPLEAGVGDLPPLLADEAISNRLLTWLRIDGLAVGGVRLRWAGVNCVRVTQRTRVALELLAPGDGDVDQQRRLGHGQVLKDSIQLSVGGQPWTLTDELEAAPAERSAEHKSEDKSEDKSKDKVFALDAEAGIVRFGDGVHGARPAPDAEIAVSYDWSNGSAGNVAAGTITRGPELPTGFKVANPIACTGGVDGEDAAAAERRIPLVLRHRDRAVSADDFVEVLKAAPGADVGRVDVLAAWHPDLSPALPGDQPGVVTAMVIPRLDPAHPDNPAPGPDFINALCNHLAPRRLVTCEVLLRGPVYTGVWISVGIEIVAGQSVAVVREQVRAALRDHLAPLPPSVTGAPAAILPVLENGWPLFRAVTAHELAAVVWRTPGVANVAGLLLADAGGSQRDSVAMQGLQLPIIAGLSVTLGDPVPLDDLIGRGGGLDGGDGGDGGGDAGGRGRVRRLPVPKVPQEC